LFAEFATFAQSESEFVFYRETTTFAVKIYTEKLVYNKMDKQEKSTTNDDVPEKREEVKNYAFVSKRVLETDHIGYCYRDAPENNIDSGWRFLYGDEDNEYLDNPANAETVYLEQILPINSALDSILSASVGCEFEWDDEQEMFVEIVK
jgi:hypothetical protein